MALGQPTSAYTPRSMFTASRLARISGLGYGFTFLINFCVTLVVARLLSPADIGVYSVAVASIALAQSLSSGGVNIFLMQARDLRPQQVASALGLAVTLSGALALIVVLISGPIASFYDQPAMRDVLMISAAGFLFLPIQAVGGGLLVRDLRLGATVLAAAAAACVAGCVTLSLVILGYGAISLAVGALSGVIASCTVIALFLRSAIFIRPRFRDWGDVWAVSGWLMGGTLINQGGTRLNELVVGKTLGIADAAYLERADMLTRMFWNYVAPPVLSVLTPLISSELRAGRDVRPILIQRLRYVSLIFVPILLGMATQGDNLLLILFGEQWRPAAPNVSWFCIASAISGQVIVISSVFTALGRTRELFIMSATEQLTRVAMLIAFAGIDIGAVSKGMLLVTSAYGIMAVFFAVRTRILTLSDIPRSFAPALLTGAAVYAVGHGWRLIDAALLHLQPVWSLALSIPLLAVVWIVLIGIVDRGLLAFGMRTVTGR